MDSQHRHELQENELAAWLEHKIDELRPYGMLIVIGLVGLVLIYSAWGYYQKASVAGEEADWDLYTTAMLENSPDMSALETASEELEKGAVANWADITLADGRLYEASSGWLVDRDNATEKLNQARDEYDRLLLTKGVSPLVSERAQLGLARSYELEGDVQRAIDAYGKVDGAFADLAKERAEALASEDLQQTVAWLQTARARNLRTPAGPGTPGEDLDFLPDSLDEPIESADDDSTPEGTLEDILKGYEAESPATEEGSAEAMEESPAEEATESASEATEGESVKTSQEEG